MKLDILEEVENTLGKLQSFAEEYWQISIIGVVGLIGYIIYLVFIK